MPRIYTALKALHAETDIIFLTDCRCSIPATARDTFNSWKRSVPARLVTLVIEEEPGNLAQVSDELHMVRSLDIGAAAVERILSL